MKMPKRIQRRRAKGWRMPPNAIYVGRPTRYANCFDWALRVKELRETPEQARAAVVGQFRAVWIKNRDEYRNYLEALRGKDLACWCPLDGPCHADVLLELANAPR